VTSVESTFVSHTRHLVREVMPMILEAFAAESRNPSRKSDGTFVTAVDTAVEERFIAALRGILPDTPILGEEDASRSPIEAQEGAYEFYASFMSAPRQVVIDPIDGTRNFVEGKREFCIAAALTRAVGGGIWPIASVVAIPIAGIMFWTEGPAVYRENLTTGEIELFERTLSSVPRVSANSADRAWLTANGFEIQPPWISSGSSVHDFLGTAIGELCGSLVGKQRLWDLMAPLAIAERLGCELCDLLSGELVTCIGPRDLSPDIAGRPWGIERKMVLLPKGGEVRALFGRA
jgi:fructose-1,6-bisphosphatase/inositol monophosphatase family enzyme